MIKKLLLAGGFSLLAATGSAQAEEALIDFKILNPDVAVEMAQSALEDCRARGFQVAVAVVDRFGNAQVMIRDRFAGAHTPDTARRKAWTAVSFRTGTEELDQRIKKGELSPGLNGISDALMLGGGIPVEAAGSIVAGIGISGAPGGDLDEACAQAGVAAVEDKIAF